MIATAPPPPGRDRVAIAGSIAIHLCVLAAALIAVPRPPSFALDEPDERALLISIVRMQHRAPPSQGHEQRPPAEAAPQARAPLPVIHAAVTVEHAARQLVVATEHRAGIPATPKPVPARSSAPQTEAAAVPVAAAAAAPASTTAAVAASAPSPAAAQHEEGIGNFGETYPASVDPSARGGLLAGASGVTVRITIDENGRATTIEFLRGPTDPAQRDELRTRLLAAHFIPAACNGLRCAGTLELRN